jgi:cyclic lactone autoinducer peptide
MERSLSLGVFARLVERFVNYSKGKLCWGFFYQPQEPECLNEEA